MYEKIIEIIAGQLGLSPEMIGENADIVEELGADSLDIVEILTALEEEFSLSVPDEEVANVRTPGEILRYIEEHQGEGS